MSKFTVIHSDDPSRYKEKILEFWKEYLPGTVPGRFDWMLRGNPAGPTHWFFALVEDTGEFAGLVSLMPKMVSVDGNLVKAGIIGDLMVDRKYRLFGPNLKLIRTLVKSAPALGCEIIYGLPNDASLKIVERVGMKRIDYICSYVKLIQVAFHLKNRLPAVLAGLVTIPAGLILRLFSKDLFVSSSGVEEVTETDESFDILWENVRSSVPGLVSDRSASFLSWRYLQNPLNRFRLLVYRDKAQSDLSGYSVFCITEDNKLWIYDIFSVRKGIETRMLKRLIQIAREAHCPSIIFSVSCGSGWGRRLWHFGFLKSKSRMALYCAGGHRLPLDSWEFFSGDRNI
jgi:hypothetical protein